MTEPTDDELAKLFTEETGFDVDDFPAAILDFARAARQRWGQPSGAGEAAEHYRNAIASACEGWTMPDGLRKHLETALWSPPAPYPAQSVQRSAICDEHYLGNSWSDVINAVEAAHGIKGENHDR